MPPSAPGPGAPEPILDPMLRVLRERHPEVDIVVLPQHAPAPVAPVLDAADRDELAAAADRSLDDLLERIAAATRGTVARDAGWHTDEFGQSWYECVAVVEGLGEGDNIVLLRSTGHALVGLGWQARPVPGDRPRLAARRRGGLEASATVRPTALVVVLRTSRVRAAGGAAR
ncbi:hypothetical protein NOCA1110050 [metagenome]|uniref:Uncharacterized protein n=1 Tax=metagenome TaxID=256318 RepID=A0A2P2C2Z2_9ZZZZ